MLRSCEGFLNIHLIGTRGCINYNPVLAITQLGYPMRGACRRKSSRLSSREVSMKQMRRHSKGSAKHGIEWKEKIKSLREVAMAS